MSHDNEMSERVEKNQTPPVITAGLEGGISSGKEAIEVYPPAPRNNIKKDTLRTALLLTQQGLSVFPCRENKAPTCIGGFKAASADPNTVTALWHSSPGQLIGVSTGAASGFDVLDIDPRHGGDKWLEANRYRLPKTRVHRTKSGGWHLLFRHHDGLRNSAGKIAQGIDTRGDGGYIIWWPASGLTVVDDVDIATWPEWLLAVLVPPVTQYCQTPSLPSIVGTAYARAALRKAASVVASAPEGCRNDSLNRECWSLLRFIDSGMLSAQSIATTLAGAALSSGLPRHEIISTLSSALRSRGIV